MTTAYHDTYRPETFDEVVGQAPVVKSLAGVLERGTSRAFLFSGPAGTGKTTLSRICASEAGALPQNILEFDAATNTGVDDMRKVRELLRYKPFGKSERQAVIIDECHRLSANAWDALLKPIEEPPAHLLWFLCTTALAKVPKTIKTRCTSYTLQPVQDRDLERLAARVMKAEKIKLSPGVLDIVIREAGGSPRQMLVNLAVCEDADDKKSAASLLQTALESEPIIELCRFLLKRGSWVRAMELVKKLENENPEGVRIVVCNYMGSVLKGAKNDKQATEVLGILEAFSEPYNSSENAAPLMLSIGRAMFGG